MTCHYDMLQRGSLLSPIDFLKLDNKFSVVSNRHGYEAAKTYGPINPLFSAVFHSFIKHALLCNNKFTMILNLSSSFKKSIIDASYINFKVIFD